MLRGIRLRSERCESEKRKVLQGLMIKIHSDPWYRFKPVRLVRDYYGF